MVTLTGMAYGASISLATPDSKAEGKRARVLTDSPIAHHFYVCGQCNASRDWTRGEYHSVVVFSESDDNVLGVSNIAVFAEEFGAMPGVTAHHSYGGTSYCVDLSIIGKDDLSEIIERMERYADYAVLDESDYSEREWAEWNESLEFETRDIPEESRHAVAEYVSENYRGASEPGYVNHAWIVQAMVALRLTPARRVRLAGKAWQGMDALVPDDTGAMVWYSLKY